MKQADWAQSLSRELLAGALPRRWAHSQGVAARARSLAGALGRDADIVEAAAWLHDIGYAPRLFGTGFHPLDGARYLRDVEQADDMLCRLVAYHTCAIIEAEERNLDVELRTEFDLPDSDLADALTTCDITTSPDGEPVDADHRISEIFDRYGDGHLVTRSMQRATPHLLEATRLVEQRQAAWRALTPGSGEVPSVACS